MPDSRGTTRILVFRNVPLDVGIHRDWNELVDSLEQPEIFYTHEWARAVEVAFSATIQPFIVIQYSGERLIGIAPMAISKERATRAYFLGASTADYCDFLGEPQFRSDLISETLIALRNVGVTDVELGQIPTSSFTLQAIDAVLRPWRFRSQVGSPCLQIQFVTEAARETVEREVRRKQAEKRHFKALSGIGKVEFIDPSSAEIDGEIVRLVRCHISRFLLTDRRSPLLDEPRVMFLRELCSGMTQQHCLKLTVLRLNDQSISWNFGFDFGGKWFWYLPTFDPEYDSYGPGTLLLRELVLSATSSLQTRVVDLGLGDEFYKTRFANGAQPTSLIRVTSSLGSHCFGVMRDTAISCIKTQPSLDRFVRAHLSGFRRIVAKARKERFKILRLGFYKLTNYVHVWQSVLFFSPANDLPVTQDADVAFVRITWDVIADCAIQNQNDSDTLEYLKRSARRLAKRATGYALISGNREVLTTGWIAPMQGFNVGELGIDLTGDGLVIFDCLTPSRHRGHGYYSELLRRLVQFHQDCKEKLVIFCSEKNFASIRGIEKAGFVLTEVKRSRAHIT